MAEEEGGQQERELEDGLGQVAELIEKGQHADAQRACRELLGAHPTSAAVHEKMGDILHHRELWQDAAEWYDLAAQLADTPGLQAKISVAESRAKEARLGGRSRRSWRLARPLASGRCCCCLAWRRR